MKVFNIDYMAAEGSPIKIVALKGYNSEDDANKVQLADGAVRLQARAQTDIASLGEPIQAALWAFKAKKDEVVPGDDMPAAIWEKLNPAPKKRLSSSGTDGNGAENGAGAGKKEKKMATTKKKAAKKAAAKKPSGGARGAKTLKVKALLERRSGCTSAEVKEATGWPAVSMPAMAKACNLKLRKEKEKGKPTRYYGT